ncbi:MAG: gamma carbonic anhydrase family protein [Candidatus Krumholzibacteriota bacterium]|nr:gamma carbonic anhydrase family protein [Candidatus Krumholzibacteriota bacterium]
MIGEFEGRKPTIGRDVYIAPGATVIGDVVLGDGASVWHGAVVRGDCWRIRIGALANIQDGCVLHVTTGGPPLVVGDRVTVGHRAVLHSCEIGDDCLVGMGAILLDGVAVGEGSIVAAGCVLLEETVVPPRSLVAGIPGTVKKTLDEKTIEALRGQADEYHRLARAYLGLGEFPLPEETV